MVCRPSRWPQPPPRAGCLCGWSRRCSRTPGGMDTPPKGTDRSPSWYQTTLHRYMYIETCTSTSRLKENKTCVCKTWLPPARNKVRIWQNLLQSYILTPPQPQGHVQSVKCKQPVGELTVQVWLLFHHPNFKYCSLSVGRMELLTDGQMDKQTDERSDF